MKSKLNSAKDFVLKLEGDDLLNTAIWSFLRSKKIGQFGQNLAKSGQTLEKVSQPRFKFSLKKMRF